MNATELIEKHEKAIEILQGIKGFELRIKLNMNTLNGFPGVFPKIRNRCYHDIEIQKKCIIRLINSYNQIIISEL